MRHLILIFTFISFWSNAQVPDYSQLTKREKIFFLNYYGYVKMENGDTIYGVANVKINNLLIYKGNPKSLKIRYPQHLKKYKYLKEISLSKVDMYYNGLHRYYKYVKKYKYDFLVLDKILSGNINVYERKYSKESYKNPSINTLNKSLFNSENNGVYELFFENKSGKLHLIIGDDEDEGFSLFPNQKKIIRERLINFFNDSYDIKTLQEIKPRAKKIIEFVEKHNSKF